MTSFILYATLLLYSIIVSQSFSYLIFLRNVQQAMEGGEYIRFRQQTDKNFRAKFSKLTLAALIANALLLLAACLDGKFNLSIAAFIAWTALLADTLLALTGNQPINKKINKWTTEKYPGNWRSYRSEWLKFFAMRQVFNIGGFCLLLAASVFLVK